jgi:tetratricopeptide (TPR) repeat protein
MTLPQAEIAALLAQGIAAHRAGRVDEALDCYARVIAAAPTHAAALSNTAVLLSRLERYEEAEPLFQRAAAANPRDHSALYGLGNLHRARLQWEEAEAAFRAADAITPGVPDIVSNLAVSLLAQGRFEEGLPLWEQRSQRLDAEPQALPFPEWTGQSLAGRSIVVWHEQGRGDFLQVARYVPLLRAAGADVLIYTVPEMVRLVAQLAPALAFKQLFSRRDYWVLSMSLPLRFGATTGNLPPPPYLAVPADIPPWSPPEAD